MTLSENRPFRLFWAGQTASNLGDAFGFVAMPLLVFDATHSVVQMGNVTALTAGGQLLAATFSGVVVDRVHRRALMIGCDLARLVLYGSLPLLAALGSLHLVLIYTVALLAAVASNLFLVAYSAAVPNLVAANEVSAANGRLQATQALTFVIGSALAGVVSARYGTVWAIGLNAVSFAASAVSLLEIQFRRDRAERAAGAGFHPLREIRSGLDYLVRHGTLRSLTLFQAAVASLGSIGIGAAVIDLLIYRLKVDFSESASVVGTSLALAAFGAVLGALLAARTGRRFGLGAVCIGGTALQGLGLVVGGLGGMAPWVVLAGVFWSAGLTFRAVGASSLRQTLTPDALLGRVLASGWTLIFGASALGAVLVTRIGANIGVAHAMALIGASLLLVAAVGSFSPLARAAG
ncbi:MAG: MFS transporter [Polyangiaceae bacterium]